MKAWLYRIDRIDVKPRPGGTDLRYSEWTTPISDTLFSKFKETLTWDDFALYPDTHALKNRIAEVHGVTPLNVYLGPGSAECIKNIFDCFREGETLVTTDPCFPMYEVYAKQNGMDITKVAPETNLSYKPKLFNKGSLVVLSRPSNPLGYLFTRKDIIKILDNNPDSWVLVDEAYIDYATSVDNIIDLLTVYNNLIISRSFSKVFGAAGCRVGYLLSHSRNIDLISKFRQMYEVSGPAMKYALFLLNNQDMVRDYCSQTIIERKNILILFKDAGYDVVPSEGNWIHIEQTPLLLKCLSKNGILIKEGVVLPKSHYDYIRMTVGPGIYELLKNIIPQRNP